jgi:hypothetical protein
MKNIRLKGQVRWSFKPNSVFYVSESLRAIFPILFTALKKRELV